MQFAAFVVTVGVPAVPVTVAGVVPSLESVPQGGGITGGVVVAVGGVVVAVGGVVVDSGSGSVTTSDEEANRQPLAPGFAITRNSPVAFS